MGCPPITDSLPVCIMLTTTCSCGGHATTIPASEPQMVSFCHCNICQRGTNSACFISAAFYGGLPSWLGLVADPEPAKLVDLPACLPKFLVTRGTVSYNAWRGQEGGVVVRAFCALCGGTIAVWRVRDSDDVPIGDGNAFLMIPVTNLQPGGFDWEKFVQKDGAHKKVLHCWTDFARKSVWGEESPGPPGCMTFPGQPG